MIPSCTNGTDGSISSTAYLSLVVINGIITFMLTPGHWGDNHDFWIGFFNPTYWPSLLFRTCICLALAGIYALITASVQKDGALKARIVRWAATWIVPSLLLLPGLRALVHSQDSRRHVVQRARTDAHRHPLLFMPPAYCLQ